MNQPENRQRALSIRLQSIRACRALDVPILLVPFFGNAQFGNDPMDPKFRAVVGLFGELLPVAAEANVILALESPTKKPALDHILRELNHPNLKIYYDTGNMQVQGEDIYAAIEAWGPETICQIHLKPFESPSGIFAQGKTDIPRLARAIKTSGYEEWLVFEAGRGRQTRDVPFAAENRKGIDKLREERRLSQAAERPNILWLVQEDTSPWMGCYGYAANIGQTPVIDQLAQDGVLFKRAYVPAPVCSSCRSGVIVGAYAFRFGGHEHRSRRGDAGKPLPEGMKTLPELFHEAGYFTFNLGKIAVRLRSTAAVTLNLFVNRQAAGTATCAGGEDFTVVQIQPGLAWKGTIESLRLQCTSPNKATIEIDWMRMVQADPQP